MAFEGLCVEFLKVIFNYRKRQAVSLANDRLRQSLMLRFVPSNIGFNAIKRQQYVNMHVTEFGNVLYNPDIAIPTVIACVDGTYCYVEKTNNF